LRIAEEIVKLVGSKRTGRVMVVGCEHIELLIELAHNGFADASCCAALAGPNGGEMSADIIVAPAVNREPKLAALLWRLESSLRPDGVLFLGTFGSRFSTRMRHMQDLLRRQGFVFVRMHLQAADLHVLCCRKLSALQTHAA
jgi:hypothetical protein